VQSFRFTKDLWKSTKGMKEPFSDLIQYLKNLQYPNGEKPFPSIFKPKLFKKKSVQFFSLENAHMHWSK
jgi:hypothetical protein